MASASVVLKPGLPFRTSKLTAGTSTLGPLSQPASSSPLSQALRTETGRQIQLDRYRSTGDSSPYKTFAAERNAAGKKAGRDYGHVRGIISFPPDQTPNPTTAPTYRPEMKYNHLFFVPASMYPTTLPLRCNKIPPRLATLKRGTSIAPRSYTRLAW